jgi:hypothetical protein
MNEPQLFTLEAFNQKLIKIKKKIKPFWPDIKNENFVLVLGKRELEFFNNMAINIMPVKSPYPDSTPPIALTDKEREELFKKPQENEFYGIPIIHSNQENQFDVLISLNID